MSTSVSFRQLLTQQQRNNKRQRASPQQLAFLKKMFEIDSRPNYATREIIGQKIDMTPRSVQIWFQNNRAKIKKARSWAGRPVLRTIIKPGLNNTSTVQIYTDDDHSDGFLPSPVSPEPTQEDRISIINCTSLSVGQWVRVRQDPFEPSDLTVFLSDKFECICYTTTHDVYLYKLILPYKAIKSADLRTVNSWDNSGVLELDVLSPELISFACQVEGSSEWMPCNDFTSGEIWAKLQHQLYGPYDELLEQCAPLLALKF